MILHTHWDTLFAELPNQTLAAVHTRLLAITINAATTPYYEDLNDEWAFEDFGKVLPPEGVRPIWMEFTKCPGVDAAMLVSFIPIPEEKRSLAIYNGVAGEYLAHAGVTEYTLFELPRDIMPPAHHVMLSNIWLCLDGEPPHMILTHALYLDARGYVADVRMCCVDHVHDKIDPDMAISPLFPFLYALNFWSCGLAHLEVTNAKLLPVAWRLVMGRGKVL